jgi:hypothetical protein
MLKAVFQDEDGQRQDRRQKKADEPESFSGYFPEKSPKTVK